MFENTSGVTEMVERERKNDRIKAYARNDLAFGFYCSKTAEFIKQFPDGNECHDINDALEEYNVVKIITTPGIKTFDLENLSRWIKNIKKSYFSYFQRICDDNIIVEEYSRVNCLYFEDFWDMFELGCLYDRISIDSIGQILALENGHALFYVLQHKKIVKKYDAFLREYMLAHPKSAEILIKQYVEKKDFFKPTFFIPAALKMNEYAQLLQKYIESENAEWNYLDALAKAKSTREFPVSDRLKYSCKKRMEEMEKTIFKNDSGISSSVTVEITPVATIRFVDWSDSLNLKVTYDFNWLDEFTDFPTILNNFIHIFEYMSYTGRLLFVKQKDDETGLLSLMGIHGKNEYRMGILQRQSLAIALVSLQAYYDFLKKRNINLIDAFVWFFEKYLPAEFHVNGFAFNVSVNGKSYLELIKLMFVELDGILRKYCLYVADGFINQELFELSSSPVSIGQIPSILEKKYLYVKSKGLENVLFWLFSDQSSLTSIARDLGDGQKFIQDKNLYFLIKNHSIYYKEFFQSRREIIDILRDKGIIYVAEDGKISLNKMKCIVLNQLYRYKVINAYYLRKDVQARGYLGELIQNGDVEYKDTLFSEPEADFLNYILNKSQYSDGMDLRNRYIHGSYPQDVNEQFRDYMIVLLVVISVILKINEEFCLKYPEENSIEWC